MPRLEIRAHATREMAIELPVVWQFLVSLPGAFGEFPMIRSLCELAESTYLLRLGSVGLGALRISAECAVRMDTSGEPILRFHAVPGHGNADADFEMRLVDLGGTCTRVHVDATVVPRMSVPRGAPAGLIARTTGAAMTVALERTLERVERRCTAAPNAQHEGRREPSPRA